MVERPGKLVDSHVVTSAFAQRIWIGRGGSKPPLLFNQNPSYALIAEADFRYAQIFEENKFAGLVRKDRVIPVLVALGAVPRDFDKHILRMHNQLQAHQITLFEEWSNPISRAKTKREIERLRRSLGKILTVVAVTESYSLEGLADYERELFLLRRSLFWKGGRRARLSTDEVLEVRNELLQKRPHPRAIAKLGDFQSRWRALGVRNFEAKPLNEWQLALVSYANFYKWVAESPDKPATDIVEDDDALDGWAASQQKSKPTGSPVSAKVAQRQNVFTIVETREEADEVYASNSPQAKAKLKKWVGGK